VARVDDPYARTTERMSPLPSGLFVEAEIEGRRSEGVFELPRAAWHEGRHLLVVDGEGRLEVRTPAVERRTRTSIIVSDGVRAGEQVVVSPLEAVVEGMHVELRGGATP
jgi:hypothetical protein